MNRDNAFKLLCNYNAKPFHIQHTETVEAVMGYFAEKLGYSSEWEFWKTV